MSKRAAHISQIYAQPKGSGTHSPRRRTRQISMKQLRRRARALQHKQHLLALVRANGCPECSSRTRIATLRRYLMERGVKE